MSFSYRCFCILFGLQIFLTCLGLNGLWMQISFNNLCIPFFGFFEKCKGTNQTDHDITHFMSQSFKTALANGPFQLYLIILFYCYCVKFQWFVLHSVLSSLLDISSLSCVVMCPLRLLSVNPKYCSASQLVTSEKPHLLNIALFLHCCLSVCCMRHSMSCRLSPSCSSYHCCNQWIARRTLKSFVDWYYE